MGFGNIGIGELMVIFLVVMVIFGPKRLPEIARNMGKFMRDFRRETNAAIKELKDGIEPIKVGIFDEPDAGAAAKRGNGAVAYEPAAISPGASAAGGAGEVPATATMPAQPTNGARKPKPRTTAKPKATTRAKTSTTATKRKTSRSAATTKRSPAKPKRPATRAAAARKR
ncbi:MAG: twin-arginine translocase TatA/TatE family subunit [Actinomycetota bacterium]